MSGGDVLDEPLPFMVRMRDLGRHTMPPTTPLSKEERRVGQLLVAPDDVQRPRTRGECADVPRPCPFVSCRYHLYLDVTPTGTLQINHPDLEPQQLRDSCALDIADEDSATLERIGGAIAVTRERVRQLIGLSLLRARRAAVNERVRP